MQFFPIAATARDKEYISRDTYLYDWTTFNQLYNSELRMHRVRAYNNVPQNLAIGATTLSFNSNEFSVPQVLEKGALHTTATNPDRFTAAIDGHYLIQCSVLWGANATGTFRVVQATKNGAAFLPQIYTQLAPAAGPGGSVVTFISATVELQYLDIIRFVCVHDAAAPIPAAADYTWGAMTLLCKLL